jgi:hypothetical protein
MVELVFEEDGQIVENTLYFTNDADWSEGTALDWLGALRDIIETELMPLLHTTIALVRLVGTLLTAVDSFSTILVVTPPIGGSVGGTVLPNGTAYTVTFNTAARGRSNRGRNYIAGLNTAAMVDGNHVTGDFRVALLAYFDAIRLAALDASLRWVVVSRFSGVDGDGKPIPRVTGVTHNITSASTFDNVVDSQRRRLPGRGA